MSIDPSPDPSIAPEPPQRKRASGPRFDALPEFRTAPSAPSAPPRQFPADPAERMAGIKEARIGPLFVRGSLWTGGAAIVYTYLAGFRHLMVKNRAAWENTFRQRVFIMSPLITLYVAGSGVLPMPFKSTLENWTGRPTLSLGDWEKVEKKIKEQRKLEQQREDMLKAEALGALHDKA